MSTMPYYGYVMYLYVFTKISSKQIEIFLSIKNCNRSLKNPKSHNFFFTENGPSWIMSEQYKQQVKRLRQWPRQTREWVWRLTSQIQDSCQARWTEWNQSQCGLHGRQHRARCCHCAFTDNRQTTLSNAKAFLPRTAKTKNSRDFLINTYLPSNSPRKY